MIHEKGDVRSTPVQSEGGFRQIRIPGIKRRGFVGQWEKAHSETPIVVFSGDVPEAVGRRRPSTFGMWQRPFGHPRCGATDDKRYPIDTKLAEPFPAPRRLPISPG